MGFCLFDQGLEDCGDYDGREDAEGAASQHCGPLCTLGFALCHFFRFFNFFSSAFFYSLLLNFVIVWLRLACFCQLSLVCGTVGPGLVNFGFDF